jgi:hypothetical protein
MHEPCALAVDNTFAPRKALLTRRIAMLGLEKMDEVCLALPRRARSRGVD